jgi:putative intracellular protease/amidase
MFKTDEKSVSFHKTQSALWEKTNVLSDMKASDFDAIFYVGGHGRKSSLGPSRKLPSILVQLTTNSNVRPDN